VTSPAFSFDPAVVDAVLHHMNDDHADDNLLIARAFGHRDATTSRMVGLDGDAGHWVYSLATAADGEVALRVEWSSAITERPEIRREIVVLYDRACAELGIEPRPHE
jgi:hypothetical protein